MPISILLLAAGSGCGQPKGDPERSRGHLDLLVLSVLHNAPAHGYAVINRLAEHSGGAFDLPEGTIYPALYRLEATGLLASDESVVDGRRRRVYRLTPAGEQAALGERVHEWEQFARSVARTLAAGT